MTKLSDEARSAILDRVLRATSLNRRKGFHFLGHFLDLDIDRRDGRALVTMNPGPYCFDENGEVDFISFGVFIDISLARCVRAALNHNERLATSSLSIALSGVPRRGRLVATTRFLGVIQSVEGNQVRAEVTIEGPDGVVASANGIFVLAVQKLATAVYDEYSDTPPMLALGDLTDDETALYRRAETSLDRAGAGQGAFTTNFWGIDAGKVEQGSSTIIDNGTQIANRHGHLQGGSQLGIACMSANAALGPDWMLTSQGVAYIRPGTGKTLTAKSEVVHQGRLTAVLMTKIFDAENKVVLQATSTHAKRTARK